MMVDIKIRNNFELFLKTYKKYFKDIREKYQERI